jgi:hypothetical protein
VKKDLTGDRKGGIIQTVRKVILFNPKGERYEKEE